MIELINGMTAKDYRQSINKNFEEVTNTINDLIQKINTNEKIQKNKTTDISADIKNLSVLVNKLQNTTKDLYKYIDTIEVNVYRHIDHINKEINEIKEQQKKKYFWQFWKGK